MRSCARLPPTHVLKGSLPSRASFLAYKRFKGGGGRLTLCSRALPSPAFRHLIFKGGASLRSHAPFPCFAIALPSQAASTF